MNAPVINLGLISKATPYIVQNPDDFFFIFGVIFCFCFHSFDVKSKSLCFAKFSPVALKGRKRTYLINHFPSSIAYK